MDKKQLVEKCKSNVKQILTDSIKLDIGDNVLVVFDTEYGLTEIITEGYESALSEFYNDQYGMKVKFINFNSLSKVEIISEFEILNKNSLVILIQTSNFRLDDFRIRLHLFAKGLKVIEHMHLYRNKQEVWDVYINSLEYDRDYLYNTSEFLKSNLDISHQLILKSNDSKLVFEGPLEQAKLNIGNYEGMSNVGGTFPIGEVFTELQDLTQSNGEIYIYAFADANFEIEFHEPFKINIRNGVVVDWDSNTPEGFVKIINLIKEYERPIIREIGFGLNKAITIERPLGDITAFERIYGFHLSLGEKHSVYKKEGITTNKTKFHVDIFPVVDEVRANNSILYTHNKYRLN